jgi:translation initiation factor IF-2
MAESSVRLNKVLKELNISLSRAVEFLATKGIEIDARPTTKIDGETYDILVAEFETDMTKRQKSRKVTEENRLQKEAIKAESKKEEEEVVEKAEEPVEKPVEAEEEKPVEEKPETPAPTAEEKEEEETAPEVVEETTDEKQPEEPKAQPEADSEPEDGVIRGRRNLGGPKTVGKIDLDSLKKPKKKKEEPVKAEKEKPEEKSEPVKEEPVKEESAPVAETSKEETPEEKPAAEKPAEETKESEEKAETAEAADAEGEEKDENIQTKYQKLQGIKDTGMKIDLDKFKKPEKKKDDKADDNKKKRRRKRVRVEDDAKGKAGAKNTRGKKRKPKQEKAELTEEEIQKRIKETLEKLTSGGKSKSQKNRRDKRQERREKEQMEEMERQEQEKTLKATEFVTVGELATMMNVQVNQVIATCMQLGIMVTMNQRLDAETLTIVAEEFGYEVDFVSAEVQEAIEVEEDKPEDLEFRSPIVTVMGHVDHGKTSLLDYIRKANVIAGESGGITQHIGAYSVELPNKERIAFIDTPGHEAFTAMRARGAKVTDIAIIVVAADDDVMPQTKEAISHAQAAGVPIIFAINKIDKPGANPEKVKESLAGMNLLVEDWGGKIQSQDISAKQGLNIEELLEKVLLEAELLDLKANPKRLASGTVIEASLDKGRGYVTTILVQNGTLRIGDFMLAGQYHGKVKAMFDERGHRIEEAGPSTPVSLLGLDGAPQAGDNFVVMEDEREAKNIANKRQQLQREQSMRTKKHITLDEIGRRLAIGDFQELNIIVKGDVDGSIEALSDSLQKLSTDEIQVNIIHKAVGQVTESDVLLASASDAIIVGFQVRPSASARKLAEKEQIEIRAYSIIYDAINDVKDAMEGMLSPEVKEQIAGTAEIRETFKISKVGTIAGCMVIEGKINRNHDVRLIREGVVIYTGKLGSLKRFKDDVKEVQKGYECGLNIENFNDIKVGDMVEAFEEVEVKKTL